MGIIEKLLYYCPRPVKRSSRLLDRVALALHLPRPKTLQNLRIPVPLLSLIGTTILYYSLASIVGSLLGGKNFGIPMLIGNPLLILFSIPIFILLWAVLDGIILEIRKRRKNILFSIVILAVLIPAVFSTSVNVGFLDRVDLAEGSVLDLNHCTALIKFKNSGLTEIWIDKVQIGGLVCDPHQGGEYLKRGETSTLAIYYADHGYLWGGDLEETIFDTKMLFYPNINITPTTFVEGKYPIRIYTDGVIVYETEIKARFSQNEEISLMQARVFNLGEVEIGNQSYCLPDVTISLDLPRCSVIFIYSLNIGNLTLTFSPPLLVTGYGSVQYVDILSFSFLGEGYTNQIIPDKPVNPALFKVGQTYDLTIRTMTNKNYTAPITMTK
jgi:hypothetical protein